MATTLTTSNVPADLSRMKIITPYSNSARYKTRPELYSKFKEMMAQAGVDLITVEIAFGNRPFEVTERDNPLHIQLRSEEELWHKENMINIAINYIMQVWPDTREIGWVDGDCFPLAVSANEWMSETWHQLQHFEFVQMWQYLIDFGPDGQPLGKTQVSFMATYEANGFTIPDRNISRGASKDDLLVRRTDEYSPRFGAPGLAWAANTAALSKVGGLIDIGPLGAGDWYMALGLVHGMKPPILGERLPHYLEHLYNWQTLADRWIKQDVGYVPVTLGHHFHGAKVGRKYGTRYQILIDNDFNPDTDLKKDAQGLYQLETWEPRQIRIRDLIRDYFRTRNEDSVWGR